MGGSYVTAADMNTGEADLDIVGERTDHVLGRSVTCGGSGSSAGDTALGVFHGIGASVRHAFGGGEGEVAGRCVLVQGVGAVGARLAELLRDGGQALVTATEAEHVPGVDDDELIRVASGAVLGPVAA